jgi:hypothetical protein
MGNIPVKDEISHCVRNDKEGAFAEIAAPGFFRADVK